MAAAQVTVIGAVRRAAYAYYEQHDRRYRELESRTHHEIVGFLGNVSLRDDKPFLHAHATFADASGVTVGGHLLSGCEVFAAEGHDQGYHRRVTGADTRRGDGPGALVSVGPLCSGGCGGGSAWVRTPPRHWWHNRCVFVARERPPMTDDTKRSAYVVLQVRDDAEEVVIRAAFRALASRYHPDANQSAGAEHRMAEINVAYAFVRTGDRRQVYDRTRHPVEATAAPIVPPTTSTWRAPVRASADDIDFGRYAGWTLEQLARHDPDYLRWLSRHSSGIRYRQRIEVLLAATSKPRAPDQKSGRR